MSGDKNPLKQEPKKVVLEKDPIKIQRDLAISLASTDSLSKGLHLCLEACLLLSGMDCGGIYLIDDITGSLNLMAHKGLSENFVKYVLTYDKNSTNVSLVKKGIPIYTSHRELGPSLLSQAEKDEGLRAFATAPLFNKKKVIGCINIASQYHDEFPETSGIAIETIAAQAGMVIARLQAKEELKAKTLKLENINTALNVLMKQRDEDNNAIQERIVLNVKKMTIPYINILRRDSQNENQIHVLDILESNLKDITSNFSLTLSSEKYGLTSTEFMVADFIRQGKKTKEIATLNNISHKTVEVHRNNIRKKLGLSGRKINLQTYLLSLKNIDK